MFEENNILKAQSCTNKAKCIMDLADRELLSLYCTWVPKRVPYLHAASVNTMV